MRAEYQIGKHRFSNTEQKAPVADADKQALRSLPFGLPPVSSLFIFFTGMHCSQHKGEEKRQLVNCIRYGTQMEIHAPEGPVTSLKEFLVHIGIVTIGILIALSLEGLLEWRHHRELVNEARANIASEVQDNRKELDYFIKNAPQAQKDQQQALQLIGNVLAHRNLGAHSSLHLVANLADLNSTSWATAQAVGALSFMEYGEVKRYARVYQLQEEFLRLQQKNLDTVTSALAVFAENKDPKELPEADLRTERSRILDSLSSIVIQQQIGQALMKRYGEISGK